MIDYFYDTSGLAKHYLNEVGSTFVDGLLGTSGNRQFISRLAKVKLQSAFTKKVRLGELTIPDFHRLTRRFQADLLAVKFEIVPLLDAHYQAAESLINRFGLTVTLRTLDALQLAVALELNATLQPIEFVSADQALCTIAQAGGLSVINPEIANRVAS